MRNQKQLRSVVRSVPPRNGPESGDDRREPTEATQQEVEDAIAALD